MKSKDFKISQFNSEILILISSFLNVKEYCNFRKSCSRIWKEIPWETERERSEDFGRSLEDDDDGNGGGRARKSHPVGPARLRFSAYKESVDWLYQSEIADTPTASVHQQQEAPTKDIIKKALKANRIFTKHVALYLTFDGPDQLSQQMFNWLCRKAVFSEIHRILQSPYALFYTSREMASSSRVASATSSATSSPSRATTVSSLSSTSTSSSSSPLFAYTHKLPCQSEYATSPHESRLVLTTTQHPRSFKIDPSYLGNYALRTAARDGKERLVTLLLQDKRVDPSSKNNWALIAASQNGHAGIVATLLLSSPKVTPRSVNQLAFRLACQNGHLGVVEALVGDRRSDPSVDNNTAILMAVQHGHTQVASLLLADKRVDPSRDDCLALKHAVKDGRVELVKLLIQHPSINPSLNNNEAFMMSATFGHLEIVKLLMKDARVNIAENNSAAIGLAADNGHIEVVRLLLSDPRIDPTGTCNAAIKMASEHGHVEIIKLLLTDPRINPFTDFVTLLNSLQNRHKKVVEVLLADPRVSEYWDVVQIDLIKKLSGIEEWKGLPDPKQLGRMQVTITANNAVGRKTQIEA